MNFVAIDSDEPKTSRESQWIFTVGKADIKDIISEKIFKLASKLKLLCLQRKQKRSWQNALMKWHSQRPYNVNGIQSRKPGVCQ